MQHSRITAAIGIALALSTSLVPLSAIAGTVSVVDPAERALVAIPGSEAGVMRDWVQLVWNKRHAPAPLV